MCRLRTRNVMTSLRQRAINGIKPGDTFIVTRTFSAEDTRVLGDLIRDYNPVHYDERFSASWGFRERICHGLLTGGMLCEIGGQLGWLATTMSFTFRRPVYFGETIRCTLTITDVDERCFAQAWAVFTNPAGEPVVEARLEGFLPREPERRVLTAMLAEGDPTNRAAGAAARGPEPT
jgi:3-hydroxybutyryl-CoA dehydratase